MFWIVSASLTLIATALLAVALVRGRNASEPAAAFDLKVYRDQLKEVDRDIARGVLNTEEAERIRTEVSRRILATDAASQAEQEQSHASQSQRAGILGIGAVLIGGSFALYAGIGGFGGLGAPGYGDLALADRILQAEEMRQNRPDQETAEASVAESALSLPQVTEDYENLVGRLRAAVQERPDDVEGHQLLARAEARLGNFAEARAAQGRVVSLKGDSVELEDLTNYADMLVLAAGGYVSPQAETVLSRILEVDSRNAVARYYYGLMLSQTGRPDTTFRIWDGLLREGPEDAPWIAPILERIDEMALRAGVQYQLPAIGSGRGPTQEDIESAGELSPSERMEMITGMVSTLSDRLATEGGPVEDWAQLITSLVVLGRVEDADAVYANALQAFETDATALDIINRAAERAGLI